MQLLTLLTLAAGALALPTQQVEERAAAATFSKSWILTDVKLVNDKQGHDSFSFHFKDPNKGLELETECSYSAKDVIGSSYHKCNNDKVAFYYDGKIVEIEREYHIPNSSPPYTEGTAFGNGNPNWKSHQTEKGKVSTVQEMHVPVTSQIAKI